MGIPRRRAGEAADVDAVQIVAQIGDATSVGTDVVADDLVTAGVVPAESNTQAIARDHIPVRGGGAADDVVGRVFDDDAIVGITHVDQARCIRTDIVAGDGVAS